MAAVFTGAVVILTIALALPGIGTSEARIDPNRYGLRTVDAAGGSSTTVEVRFTVRPVIVLVVGADGRPLQLWTNLPGRPAAEQTATLRVRQGSLHGRDLAVSSALRLAAAPALAAANWGRPGLIWTRG
jgi:hypothetical protein